MASLLVLLVLAVGSTVVIWKGSELLENAAARLSHYYGLPAAVHGEFSLGVGAVRSFWPG